MNDMDYVKLYMALDSVENYILKHTDRDPRLTEITDRCAELIKIVRDLAPTEAEETIDIYEKIAKN